MATGGRTVMAAVMAAVVAAAAVAEAVTAPIDNTEKDRLFACVRQRAFDNIIRRPGHHRRFANIQSERLLCRLDGCRPWRPICLVLPAVRSARRRSSITEGALLFRVHNGSVAGRRCCPLIVCLRCRRRLRRFGLGRGRETLGDSNLPTTSSYIVDRSVDRRPPSGLFNLSPRHLA